MPIKLIAPREGKTPYYAGRGTYLGIYVDRSTKTGKRALAKKVIEKWEREIERGEFSQRGEPTFASAAAAYMKAGGDRRFLKRLLEHFGDRPLRQIDQTAIDHAAQTLYPQGSAATRNRQVYTPVSAVLRGAGNYGLLRRPRGAAGNKQTAWLWPEEAHRLFEEAEKINPEFAALLITLCYTGMRLSEALNLTWENVRLQDGFAYVPQTKNDEPRSVFLPPVAVAAMANLAALGVEGGSSGDGGRGRVFRLAKSGHLYSLLRLAAIRACVEFPVRSAYHVFRHTYATWMRRYGGADSQALIATGAWKDRKSVDRYTHTVVSEEARKALLLPTPKRTNCGK
jgi:integrase